MCVIIHAMNWKVQKHFRSSEREIDFFLFLKRLHSPVRITYLHFTATNIDNFSFFIPISCVIFGSVNALDFSSTIIAAKSSLLIIKETNPRLSLELWQLKYQNMKKNSFNCTIPDIFWRGMVPLSVWILAFANTWQYCTCCYIKLVGARQWNAKQVWHSMDFVF